MVNGFEHAWRGYKRWALRCIKWMPIVRKWQREQREHALRREAMLSQQSIAGITRLSAVVNGFYGGRK